MTLYNMLCRSSRFLAPYSSQSTRQQFIAKSTAAQGKQPSTHSRGKPRTLRCHGPSCA